MSQKINVTIILKDHFNTFVNLSNRPCVSDYICFVLCPIILACVSLYFRYALSSDATSALINFGAIITALLLSVLVLVFDQDKKLAISENKKLDKSACILYSRRKKLFKHLYSNICYSIIMSILLVLACLLDILFGKFTIPYTGFTVSVLFSTAIIFTFTNLILTILMVTKRIYTVLTITSETNEDNTSSMRSND